MRMCNAFRMLGVLLAAGIGIARGQSTYCVSATENGVVSNGWSGFGVSMSPDGRYVAFDSYATNLAPQGGNGYWQVLIHDRETGELELVSQTSGGDLAIRSATQPSVSADGRFVAFIAEASNFDSFPQGGIFVRDRVARTTSRAILSSAGGLPNGGCFDPALSADGRFLAFTTTATNLAGGGSSGPKVFVLDRATGVTSNVSVNSSGQAADADCFSPRISSDGRYVAFESYATNLYTSASNANPYYFRHDRASGMTARVVASASGGDVQNAFGYGLPSISADGRFVAFSSFGATLVPDDTNGQEDVFVRDMDAGVTVRASVDSAGVQGNLDSFHAVISADGRFVVFDSYATNLVPGGTNGSRQVIVHDLASGATRLASTGASGTAGNRSSGQYQRDSSGNMRFPPNTAISREGRRIAFASEATNLVPGEFNNVQDVFVREQWSLSVDSVLPSSGSESGGDLVTLRGIGFESATDTGVDFGGTAAKVVSVSDDHVSVRTPPGSGVVDVRVQSSRGNSSRAAGFTYLPPEIAARHGNVNVALGEREAVLLVNAVSGDSMTREIAIGTNQPITAVVLPPSNRASARFAIYAWGRAPRPSTLSPLPRGLGAIVLPPPLLGGSPPVTWNNLGHTRALGIANRPSSLAPSILFRSTGIATPRTFSLQGLIEDDGSAIPQRLSVTNAVIVRVHE